MTKNVVEVDFGGLERLKAAAASAGESEMDKLVKTVIAELRSVAPYDVFEDVFARHVWDEFCWCQQEGSFMDNMESVIRSKITGVLDKLDDRTLVCLTACSRDELGEIDQDGELGVGAICIDDINLAAYQRIQEAAQGPDISIIGPHRADELGFHLVTDGVVFSELSESELSAVLAEHFEDIIDPAGDLSGVSNALAQGFLEQIEDESESLSLSAFLDRFKSDVKTVLAEKDVLPDLKGTRAALLEALDSSV